jgi:FkbM family methyltransferase
MRRLKYGLQYYDQTTAKIYCKRLIKAVVPVRAQVALRRLAEHRRRIRGRPFPYVISHLQSESTLNCCVTYNKYGAYCVPVSGLHRPAALCVQAGDVWEARTIEFITSHCKGGDIVHAGTFFGDFLPALASALTGSGKVWAFEPNPESYRCAAITIQLNQLSNVELINAGLGERSGAQPFITHAFNGIALGGSSQMAPSGADSWEARGDRTVMVQLETIDDTVPAHRPVSIIHLDVEGYEKRALAGAMRTIERQRPVLVVETLPDEQWVSEHLRPLGYRIANTVLENTVLCCG